MIKVKTWYQLSWAERIGFRQFCRVAGESKEPAAHNMAYLHEIMHRFTVNGVMTLAFDGDQLVACSGGYRSDFSPEVGILGARTWVNHSHRGQQIVRDHLLPAQRDWMIEREVKQVALTFNEYNRNLISLFERQVVKRVPRSPRHMFYSNMNALPYRVMIQYVPQWVVYEKLDQEWEFDWATLQEDRVVLKLDGQ